MIWKQKNQKLCMINVFLFFTLAIIGCKKENSPNPAPLIKIGVNIKYINTQGENLFKNSTLDIDKIKLYFIENGEEKLVNKPSWDHPHGFWLLNNINDPILSVLTVNLGYKGDIISELNEEIIGKTKAKLDFDGKIDIIVTEWKNHKNQHTISKVWYNDKLVFDLSKSSNDSAIDFIIKE